MARNSFGRLCASITTSTAVTAPVKLSESVSRRLICSLTEEEPHQEKRIKEEREEDTAKSNQDEDEDEVEVEVEVDGEFVNKQTGEVGGPRGPEPTRFGDWERNGRCSDF